MKPGKVNKIVEEVTIDIIKRSKSNRLKYLKKLNAAKNSNVRRDLLSCGNIAHSIAGCSSSEKKEIISGEKPNIAIVSAYNDMLSAHKPYENYPSMIKKIIQKNNRLPETYIPKSWGPSSSFDLIKRYGFEWCEPHY